MGTSKKNWLPLGFATLVVVCCVVLLFDQVKCWNSKDDYLFGYLVPVFVAFVLKERWPKIRAIFIPNEVAETEVSKSGVHGGTAPDASLSRTQRGGDHDVSPTSVGQKHLGEEGGSRDEFDLPGFVPAVPAPKWLELIFGVGTIFSLLIFSTGALGSVIYGVDAFTTYQNTAGFIGICLGAAWFASADDFSGNPNDLRTRGRLLLLLVFPIFVWLISGPFTFLADRQIKTLLLKYVTDASVFLLNSLSFDLVREGNTIVLANGERVGVEDACSGVRSLTACLFAGSFIAAVFMRSVKKKFFFVVLSVIGAMFLNILRTSVLAIWATFNGSNAIELDFWGNAPDSPAFSLGTVHDIVGWSAMLITLGIMFALIPVVNLKLRKSNEEMQISFVDEEE